MSASPLITTAVTARERLSRRAAEARAAVAGVWPELLDEAGVDTTLADLALSRTVLERLESGQRFELAKEWLRGLPRAKPSQGR